MNVILLGCPGSGKGTQAAILCKEFSLSHIATGDIFRDEMSRKTELGQKMAGHINSGKLVPDKLVLDVVQKKLDSEKGGVLLDGFPRTIEQAQALDSYFEKLAKAVDAVVFIKTSEQEVVNRLAGRRSCPKCGLVYNVSSNPPKSEGVCDKCGNQLLLRDDDKPETIRRRLMVYYDITRPLVEYYRSNHSFCEVDGSGPPQAVTDAVIAFLRKR